MKKIREKAAFTLIEIIVVLFIISMGLVGILSLIVQNIQAQDYNRGNLIAYQLSQEGIELIRRVRDTNWRNSVLFYENLADGLTTPKTFIMDYDDNLPVEASEAAILRIDDEGFYAHSPDTWEASEFSRLIEVELVDSDHLRVISSVFWVDRGRENSYVIEALLYDWR